MKEGNKEFAELAAKQGTYRGKSYETWQQEAREHRTNQNQNLASLAENEKQRKEIPLTEIMAKLDIAQAKAGMYSSQIDLKEVMG